MRNLTIALGLLIFALAGFYGGAKYESGRVATATTGALSTAAGSAVAGSAGRASSSAGAGTGGSATAGAAGAGGGSGFGAAGGFGRGTIGQISAINGSTLTITDAQGNQVKVLLQPSTTIARTVAGSQSDLTSGVTVTVSGQRGSDGTLTATAVTIVPAGLRPGGATGGG